MPEPTSPVTLDLRPMVRAAKRVLIVFILLFVMDIAMMVISIMAYTGAHSDGDRAAVKEIFIVWTSTGHIVQRAIIGLTALGLVVHPILAVVLLVRMGRIKRSETYVPDQSMSMRRYFAWLLFPWIVFRVLAWAVCLGFQTTYLPFFFPLVLLKCHHWGAELTQCSMLNTTWIAAIVYICMYILQSVFAGMAYYRLQMSRTPKSRTTYVYEMVDPVASAAGRNSMPPPAYQLDPPSYVAEASSSPVFELPPAKEAAGTSSKAKDAHIRGYSSRVV